MREKKIDLNYNGQDIGKCFLDFIIDDKIILEVKVANIFHSKDIKQTVGYLKTFNLDLGILTIITKDGIKYKRVLKGKTICDN